MKKANIEKLVKEALAIEAEDAKQAGALGFMARILVQATLPHSKTAGSEFIRKNGNYTLSLLSPSHIGLPYGALPRLLLAWLTTEAVRTGQRELVLGDSMSAFMRELGLIPTGGRWGSITRLKDQTKRLFSAHVACHYADKNSAKFLNLGLVESGELWWNPANPDQQSLWQSTVKLDHNFFNEIIDRPVPVDMRALKALKQSAMALDIYSWLTYRNSYLRQQTEIPWQSLQAQFGAGYPNSAQGLRDFRKKFIQQMKRVSVIYPEAKVSTGDYGLILKPSQTHIGAIKK